jgi:uncharacterized membrane protein
LKIEDAVIGTKSESGAVALTQLSNASSFWEVRAAASGYPVPPVAGVLTDYGGDDKFVKEIAEAIPSGRAFRRFDDRRRGGVFDSYNEYAAPTIRAAFSKWKCNGRN